MTTIAELDNTLPSRLAELASEHGVVGASVAVQQGESVVQAATGLANLRADVEATTDTLFQRSGVRMEISDDSHSESRRLT